MIAQLEASIVNLDVDGAITIGKDLLQSPDVSSDDIFRAIGRALDVVGQKYEEKTYFLTELIMAGEVVKEILQLLGSSHDRAAPEPVATIVLATVRGDLHDIGKNIFAMLLQSQGFKVIDLGLDVLASDIVHAVREQKPEILGLSALLTTTVPEFETIVQALEGAGLRDQVKIIVGGAAVNQEIVDQYCVDAWGKTVVEGLKICKQWYGTGGG